jgi:hypothetical protein
MSGKWVGGENFIKIKRGSNASAGGKNSGPVGRRKTRFFPVLMKNLAAQKRGLKRG